MASKNQTKARNQQKIPGHDQVHLKNIITMQACKPVPACINVGNYLHLCPISSPALYLKKYNVNKEGDINF